MKKETVKEMEEIWNERNTVFRRIRIRKKEATDLAGNNCIKNKNGKVVFAENGRKRVWKEHMKAIMNDGMVNVEVVEGPIEPFATNEVERALRIMKNGKASGPAGIVKEHIAVSPHGKQVILQILMKSSMERICLMTGGQVQFLPFIRRKVAISNVLAIEM